MSAEPIHGVPVDAEVPPGSRLESLLAAYADLKPRADDLAERLRSVTDAIKAELTAAQPGAGRINVSHPALAQPLRLTYAQRWELDTKRFKAEHPDIYVRYARQAGRWELRGLRG